jgi:GT2 family glycosyltransferase
MHTLSVILCAYTEARWDDLLAAVDSLLCQTLPPHEIIVAVDHNPLLAARVRRGLPNVQVVENTGARGLSGARNAGVAAAQGSIIVFLDDDAAAAPDWLAQIAAAFANPTVAGTGGAIEPAWRVGRPAWFPTEFDWVVGCTYRGMPETPTPVRNLIGCNMAFRREVFDTIGGFRIGRVGALSIGQENDETEFCIRLAAAKPDASLLYKPAARVWHTVSQGRATFRYFARRCFSEGMSKAALSRQVGADSGLATERSYTLHTLPQGVLKGLVDTLFRGDSSGLLRASAIVAGFATTAAGFLAGHMLAHSRPQAQHSTLSQQQTI